MRAAVLVLVLLVASCAGHAELGRAAAPSPVARHAAAEPPRAQPLPAPVAPPAPRRELAATSSCEGGADAASALEPSPACGPRPSTSSLMTDLQ